MLALATCTVSILRGTSTDNYGDLNDTATVVASGVPASLLEQRRVVTTFGDDRPQVVRYWTGRVPAGTDIQADDRVLNEQTNAVFIVDSLSTETAVVHNGETRVDLRRTT